MDALRTAVARRMVADVPVGVLLSGGIDSSIVVALLAEQGQHGLATFSIGFDSVGGESGDEYFYSDLIAKTFDTDHHRIHIDCSRLLPAVPKTIAAMSEPMVSHDCVAFYLLSEEVSKSVKVVQSGQGADEILAGYDWYPPLADVAREQTTEAYAKVFFDRGHADVLAIFAPSTRIAGEDPSRQFVKAHQAAPGADTAVDAALRLDTQVMLVDDPVKRVDTMTMAWGLEARVPFLDHDFVELAATCPAELKLAAGGKGVLKDASRALLPSEVIDRTKGYFPVPGIRHLHGDGAGHGARRADQRRRPDPRPVPPGNRRRAARRSERNAYHARRQRALATCGARDVVAEYGKLVPWDSRCAQTMARRCRRTRPRSPTSSTTAAIRGRCSGSCAAGARVRRATSNCPSRAPSPASSTPPTATGWPVEVAPEGGTRSQIWVVTTDPDDRDARRIDTWPAGVPEGTAELIAWDGTQVAAILTGEDGVGSSCLIDPADGDHGGARPPVGRPAGRRVGGGVAGAGRAARLPRSDHAARADRNRAAAIRSGLDHRCRDHPRRPQSAPPARRAGGRTDRAVPAGEASTGSTAPKAMSAP